MKLENWSIGGSGDPYQAPELYIQVLYGNVYGHPNIEDGNSVITSAIIKAENDLVYTKSGSIYELGEISEEYEKAYPGARARLFVKEKKLKAYDFVKKEITVGADVVFMQVGYRDLRLGIIEKITEQKVRIHSGKSGITYQFHDQVVVV